MLWLLSAQGWWIWIRSAWLKDFNYGTKMLAGIHFDDVDHLMTTGFMHRSGFYFSPSLTWFTPSSCMRRLLITPQIFRPQ